MCFTSGTTGEPKGVKTTHRNLLSKYGHESLGPNNQRIYSFLPVIHAYEQGFFVESIVKVEKTGFSCGDHTKMMVDCQKLKPNVFPCVPRVYNKIYASML